MADTHTVMPKKLAQALMEAGVQHFDAGGIVGALGVGNNFTAQAGGNPQQQVETQYGQQQDIYGQQQALASQLLAQTQGVGPGNALVQQQAANNAAAQAATMAGVRGASANPGLIARNAAVAGQQGQQQALNTQAALQLQSQGALGQQQSQMANQALQGQSIAQGAIASANGVNAGVAGQNAGANQGILGGLIGGAAGAIGSLFNQGGEVKKMAVGGQVNDNIGIAKFGGPAQSYGGIPSSPLGSAIGGALGQGIHSLFGPSAGQTDEEAQQGYLQADSMLGIGGLGVDPSMQGMPGINQEVYAPAALDPSMMAAAHGGRIPQMVAGGDVAGKAKTKGDSEKNDTVPTMLSPGEVVIPRSIAQSADAPRLAAEFIKHLKAKKKGYGGVVAARKARG